MKSKHGGFLLLAVLFGAQAWGQSLPLNRQYPGGADESDLVVQEQVPVPEIKLDRKTVELRVLKNFGRGDQKIDTKNESTSGKE
jgi:hypothetical protein